MIAEESETPAGGPPQRSERDLLAERRARRAAESGDTGLLRRAEAAEATVKTLETHLASLRQRLLETEESARRSAERLAERELQLRRVKQQEYAEQQLRIEAEQALEDANRRIAGIDGYGRALNELQQRVAELERRSIKLERSFDQERRTRERGEQALEQMRRSHTAIAATLGELRTLAASLRALAQRDPAGEAAAASSAPTPPPTTMPAPAASPAPQPAVQPRAPEPVGQPPVSEPVGQPPTPEPVGEPVPEPVGQPPAPESVGQPPVSEPVGQRSVSSAPASSITAAGVAPREDLAEALAVAVERLRARAEAEASRTAQEQEAAPAPSAASPAQAAAPAAAVHATARSASIAQAHTPAKWPPTHRHSMSLIGRWRAARKHRRQSRHEERRAG